MSAGSEFSLLGHNHDAFEHLAIANGFHEVRNLAAGDYEEGFDRSLAKRPHYRREFGAVQFAP